MHSDPATAAINGNIAEGFIDILKNELRFDSVNLGFCPHYSWFGISKHEKLGIERVRLYHSRASPLLSSDLLTFEVNHRNDVSWKAKSRVDLPLEIEEQGERGFSGPVILADMDIVCYHAKLIRRPP